MRALSIKQSSCSGQRYIRGNQRSSEAIRGSGQRFIRSSSNLRRQEIIRGHQRQSEALSNVSSAAAVTCAATARSASASSIRIDLGVLLGDTISET